MADDVLHAHDILARKLGYVFTNTALLDQALTHATWANEQGAPPAHDHAPGPPLGRAARARQHSYERLEFLGDAVLQLLSSAHLFAAMPHASEGALSRRRAQLVREPTLAALAQELQVAPHVRVGSNLAPGSAGPGGAQVEIPCSILADIMEAILAAVYLDGGLAAAAAVALPWLRRLEQLGEQHIDHKTALQELCHRRGGAHPVYTVTQVTGPAHARTFHVTVTLAGDVLAAGVGTSKKAAEQLCARGALQALGLSQQS